MCARKNDISQVYEVLPNSPTSRVKAEALQLTQLGAAWRGQWRQQSEGGSMLRCITTPASSCTSASPRDSMTLPMPTRNTYARERMSSRSLPHCSIHRLLMCWPPLTLLLGPGCWATYWVGYILQWATYMSELHACVTLCARVHTCVTVRACVLIEWATY